MKNYKKKILIFTLVVLSVLTIFFIRKKENKNYQLLNEKENCFYDVSDMKTKLVLIKKCKDSKDIDSIIFYKNKDEYFQMLFNLGTKSEDQKLVLSNKKEIFYYYGPRASFYCNIKRLNKNKFKTTLANKDSINSKYRFSLYYDIHYKISRIEYVLDDQVVNYR